MLSLRFILLACLWLPSTTSLAQSPNRVTILVDAFGQPSQLRQDWGFSALIEYGGKRILFDTGNNAEGFAHNVRTLQVDLSRLDLAVISHRHGDHTDGLHYLLKVNPNLPIYVPDDEYFGGPTPAVFFRQGVPSLPVPMRYFNGQVPEQLPHGSPWRAAHFQRVDSVREVLPGIRLVRNLATGKQFGETPELSLSIRTPKGQVLIVGCSHPGIEPILASLKAKQERVYLLVGGLHLVTSQPAEVGRLASALRDEWQLQEIAPGHCSGEVAFSSLQQAFGNHYRYAGVGTVIELP